MFDQVAQWSVPHFWTFTGIASAFALVGFWLGLRGTHRARLIQDVPTARIRSAHQGYVELTGKARMLQGTPVIAPLSKQSCCWFRYRIDKQDDNKWKSVRSGSSDGLFLLDDDTGHCVVDPVGADITSSHKKTWYGNDADLNAIPLGDGINPVTRAILDDRLSIGNLKIRNALTLGQRYRFTEELILEDDPLYAIGGFKSLDDLDHHKNRSDLTRDILSEWKQQPEALKERFDHNNDGEIDMREWASVREEAETQARETYAEQIPYQHLHSLSAPASGRRPYLISNYPEFKLVRRYRWQAIGGFVLFFAAGAGAVHLISQRLA